jgi:hypothetical protein
LEQFLKKLQLSLNWKIQQVTLDTLFAAVQRLSWLTQVMYSMLICIFQSNLICNIGGDITSLKRHGGWASSNVAESYIQESVEEKIKIARKVFSGGTGALEKTEGKEDVRNKSSREECGSSGSSAGQSFQFNNCTFNF